VAVARFINHSCRPNLVAVKTNVRSNLNFSAAEAAHVRLPMTSAVCAAEATLGDRVDDIIFFVALRDICAGEELFFDYNRAVAAPARAPPGTQASALNASSSTAWCSKEMRHLSGMLPCRCGAVKDINVLQDVMPAGDGTWSRGQSACRVAKRDSAFQFQAAANDLLQPTYCRGWF